MDLNTYKYEIYKDAKEKEDKKNEAKNVAKSVAGGALATGAGAAAYNEYGKGEITGTRTGYHGTDKKNVAGIKEKGILPTKSAPGKSITKDVLYNNKDFKSKINDADSKAYVARKKFISKGVQKSRYINGLTDDKKGAIIKTKMPYSEYLKRRRENPETRGFDSRKDYVDSMIKGEEARLPKGETLSKFNKAKLRSTFHYNNIMMDKGSDTLEGVVDSKYIVGGKGYKNRALKNFKDHVKNNPKVFAKGVGKAGLIGAAGIGGIKMISDSNKKMKEKTAYEILDEALEKIAAEKKDEKKDLQKDNVKQLGKSYVGGAAAIGAGVAAHNEYGKGEVTGTRTGYHVTDKKNVQSIKEKGILPTKDAPGKSITKNINQNPIYDKNRSDFDNKTYVARKKSTAKNVGLARQQQFLADGESEILKTKMPYSEYKKKKRVNPEIAPYKNKNNYANKKLEELQNHPFLGGLYKNMGDTQEKAVKKQFKNAYKQLDKGTDTLEGAIKSKYIVGGKGYKKSDAIKNFTRHVKENPGVFAKGVGKAGLIGAAGIGGAKAYIDATKKTRQNNKKIQELSKKANEILYGGE